MNVTYCIVTDYTLIRFSKQWQHYLILSDTMKSLNPLVPGFYI